MKRHIGLKHSGTISVAIVLAAAMAFSWMMYSRTSSVQAEAQTAQAPSGTQVQSGGTQAQDRGRAGRRGGGFHEPAPLNFDDHTGYTPIFDGTDLKGWDGDPSVWHVEDGAIVGISTLDHPAHSDISYKDLVAKDLDLKLEMKVEQGGGSGIQYRSKTGPWPGRGSARNPTSSNPDWLLTGPQADFWFPVNPGAEQYTGQFYTENNPLGIVAWRGEVVEMGLAEPPHLVGNIQDRRALGGYVKTNDWNQYEVIARGGTFLHIINGQLMAVLVDDNVSDVNNQPGLVGIEIESSPCKVSVRNIWVKKFN